jgi:hypothetical protein
MLAETGGGKLRSRILIGDRQGWPSFKGQPPAVMYAAGGAECGLSFTPGAPGKNKCRSLAAVEGHACLSPVRAVTCDRSPGPDVPGSPKGKLLTAAQLRPDAFLTKMSQVRNVRKR